MSSCRSVLLGLLVLLTGAVSSTAIVSGAAAAPADGKVTAWLSDPAPVAGSTITVGGKVPGGAERPVVLERRTTGEWGQAARTTSAAGGNYRFTDAPGSTTTYRVRAPRFVRGGTTYKAALSTNRTVEPVAVQPPEPPQPPAPEENLATRASASSSVEGSGPARLLSPGGQWRADGETVGAWVEVGLDSPASVRRLVIRRAPLDEPGVTAGFLSFDDGSQLQVRLSRSEATTVLPVTPRRVGSVRFTVTEVERGADAAALRSVAVQATPDPEGDVVTGGDASGDAAPAAAVTASGGDAGALTDGGEGGVGRTWAANATGAWAELRWARPRELTTVSVAGVASSAQLRSATLRFSDGSTLFLGGVQADASRPTVVSFMPRVTRWVRLEVDSITGSGELELAEISTLQPGATPLTAVGGPAAAFTERPVDCSSDRIPSDSTGLLVRCPTSGDRVGRTATVEVALAPSYGALEVSAWSADGSAAPTPLQTLYPNRQGVVRAELDLADFPAGPLTVGLTATAQYQPTRKAFLGLFRNGSSGVRPQAEAMGPKAGRSLVWTEDFERQLSLSKVGQGVGADYYASKPEYWGPGDFSDAIFPSPTNGFGTTRVLPDFGLLRLSTMPNPAGYSDPNGWGRTRMGGYISSGRAGGSGFAAQYGYFEARMLLPAGVGTWPAFWMLPTDNLVEKQDVVAEIDALEHYGENPQGACHTTHRWPQQQGKGGVTLCTHRRWATEREALTWHTFGVAIEPDRVHFYIDGQRTGVAPQVEGGDDPMFWMVNLALGGGWRVDLDPTQDRTELYVDWVRAYV